MTRSSEKYSFIGNLQGGYGCSTINFGVIGNEFEVFNDDGEKINSKNLTVDEFIADPYEALNDVGCGILTLRTDTRFCDGFDTKLRSLLDDLHEFLEK